jgi:EF-hand domain pair
MNLSATSSSSSSTALWSLLAARQASRSSNSSGTSETASSSSPATQTTGAPPGPPPPPSGFDMSSMGTMQFAAMSGRPSDPIASLDSDDDGSVSADEFGLDAASEEVQALFKAIDSDGSGALSSDEIDSFREEMTSQDHKKAGGQPPDGPPPPPPEGGQGGGSMDVSAFLEQLAQRYASMQTSSETTTTGSTVDAAA